jgi:hypothetical protein
MSCPFLPSKVTCLHRQQLQLPRCFDDENDVMSSLEIDPIAITTPGRFKADYVDAYTQIAFVSRLQQWLRPNAAPKSKEELLKELFGGDSGPASQAAAEALAADPLRDILDPRMVQHHLNDNASGVRVFLLNPRDSVEQFQLKLRILDSMTTVGMWGTRFTTRLIWRRAGFFTVPKSNGKLRIITDARPANRICKKPPHFSLPTVEDIIKLVQSLPEVHAATTDLRHWFHQIPIPASLRRLFYIRSAPRWFGREPFVSPKVLPMGWTAAPFVAQCCAWTVILSGLVDKREEVSFRQELGITNDAWSMLKLSSEPPSVLPLRKGSKVVGYIVVYIDNMLILTSDPGLRDAWVENIDAGAKKFNAEFKSEGKAGVACPTGWCTQRDSHNWCLSSNECPHEGPYHDHIKGCPCFSFLGILFCKCGWRIDPSRLGLPCSSDAIREQRLPITYRLVASIVGRLLYSKRLERLGLLNTVELYDLAVIAPPRADIRSSWGLKVPSPVVERVISCMPKLMEEYEANPIRFHRGTHRNAEHVFLSSDAHASPTVTGGAGVVLFKSPPVALHVAHSAEQHSEFVLHKEIFVLEADAVVLALDTFANEVKGKHVVFGEDNTTVIYAFKAGFSANPRLRSRIQAIYERLEKLDSTLEMVYIPSAFMAADAVSRPFV